MKWGSASATFWGLQFMESLTSTTYDCLDHLRHADCAIEELEKLRAVAPRVDMAITNWHQLSHYYPDGTEASFKFKVITGGESRQMKIENWKDLSKSPSFLKECTDHEHKEPVKALTRVSVNKNIEFSPAAAQRFNEEKQ